MRNAYRWPGEDDTHVLCLRCMHRRNIASPCPNCGWNDRPVMKLAKKPASQPVASPSRVLFQPSSRAIARHCPRCKVVQNDGQFCAACLALEFDEEREFLPIVVRALLQGIVLGGTLFGVLFQLLHLPLILSTDSGAILALGVSLLEAMSSRKFARLLRSTNIGLILGGVAKSVALFVVLSFLLEHMFLVNPAIAKLIAVWVFPFVYVQTEAKIKVNAGSQVP